MVSSDSSWSFSSNKITRVRSSVVSWCVALGWCFSGGVNATAALDLNGDGTAEIAMYHTGSTQVVFLDGTGAPVANPITLASNFRQSGLVPYIWAAQAGGKPFIYSLTFEGSKFDGTLFIVDENGLAGKKSLGSLTGNTAIALDVNRNGETDFLLVGGRSVKIFVDPISSGQTRTVDLPKDNAPVFFSYLQSPTPALVYFEAASAARAAKSKGFGKGGRLVFVSLETGKVSYKALAKEHLYQPYPFGDDPLLFSITSKGLVWVDPFKGSVASGPALPISAGVAGHFLTNVAAKQLAALTDTQMDIYNAETGDLLAQSALPTVAQSGQFLTLGAAVISEKKSPEVLANGGARICQSYRPINDGPQGFLVKNSDFHPGSAYLTDAASANGRLIDPNTEKVIEKLQDGGIGNGFRHHWRSRGRLPRPAHIFAVDIGGQTVCYKIPQGSTRID